MYPFEIVKPMKEELTSLGFKDLTTAKEVNKNIQSREKATIEREKMQTDQQIANTQLEIARENKNQYDFKKDKKEKDSKKKK